MDQDGAVVDVFLQEKRDAPAASRFFKRFLGAHAAVYNLLKPKVELPVASKPLPCCQATS